MRIPLLYIVILFAFSSCRRENKTNYTYVKILTEGIADSIDSYNKGFSLHNLLYYEPDKDSVIFRFYSNNKPQNYITYTGNFGNSNYPDTIVKLIQFLKHHNNGILESNFHESTIYDGAQFFVEYKDSEGIHNNSFIIFENDTLYEFNRFFHRLLNLPWKRKQIDNKIIHADSEYVEAAKKVGLYHP